MNLDTLALECFMAVADTGSFTQAAQRVNRTQSAVSQQVAKLEQWVGKPLFHRDRTKKLEVTNEGELFKEYAQKILSLHWEVIDRFKEPELEGEFRFGLPEDFSALLLADVLVEFFRIHPRVLINIECDLTLNLLDRFKNNEFDLVLLKMSQPKDFPHGIKVFSEKLQWVGDEKVFLNFYQKQNKVPLVVSPQPCVYRSRAIRSLEDADIRWQLVFTSPSYSTTLAAVKAGLGITVLPEIMMPQGLKSLHHPLLPSLSDTHVSLLKHDEHNPVIRSFEEFVFKKLRH